MTTLDDLWEVPPDDLLPPLDRADAKPTSSRQYTWWDRGVIVLPRFMPDERVDAYCDAYLAMPHWFDGDTPYMRTPEIRDLALYPPLTELLGHLIGEPMGLHLNLTGWVSTERDWHQDDYLNPPHVNGWYAAVWVALGDIHPDSGPFQYVPGSHTWPLIRREKMLAALGEDGSEPNWPKRSEAILSPLFEERIANRGEKVETFLAKKGDVLVWHSRLLHRGSKPNVPGMERRAVISHYSGVNHRLDMPHRARHASGGVYFVL